MAKFNSSHVEKSGRIQKMIDVLYENMPEIEPDRGVLVTEAYKATEGLPVILRRSYAFRHILSNIPIVIRPYELIVGSTTIKPRGCQVFPEFSFEWLLAEFDTIEHRSADPFYISEDTKQALSDAYKYWGGKTTSDLARSFMAPETLKAMEHNVFTPGNYFYNGVGHVTVRYDKILEKGFTGIKEEAVKAMKNLSAGDLDYGDRISFLKAVCESCDAVMIYAERYEALALEMADKEQNPDRKKELLTIASNLKRVPAYGAESFYQACQSFWFVQMLLQVESSGHSISPGRFDQYMYPYYKADIESGKITREFAQELMDNIWVKLNDINKARDEGSADGFAGYGLFQNLICGGQDENGVDATNDLSFMCLEATLHVMLPQPSLSVRIWSKTPHEFLIRAAEVTRTGVGLPAYYNDEVIIPALINRGLTLKDARDYNIIGCVEPQKAGKTEGWHDAAFFNMLKPLELTLESGYDKGELVGIPTKDVCEMTSFEEFFDSYKTQMNHMIELLVNADNSIDLAHSKRCPLPFESSMIDDCIGRGKSTQEGGAVYNFTGPQGFGIANVTDSLYAIKKLVFDDKKISMKEYREAVRDNFGQPDYEKIQEMTSSVIEKIAETGREVTAHDVETVIKEFERNYESKKEKYSELLNMIDELPKYGNDVDEVDLLAREVAYTYTRPIETYKNPRGGNYQAGLYPVSANVPLGYQTGATPDGRLSHKPIADGVGPAAGRDVHGPTAAANSVAKLDHFIASNGTLFNQKFHPSALSGTNGLMNFASLIRGFFDQKGMHVQFNVISKETLLDAQAHPENYKNLVVRVAGYSALFTTLSKSLQDDIINRTEQGF